VKIHSLYVLSQVAAELRKAGSTLVLANGCFDLLHVGHLKHLQAAKRLGDVLMVTVTRDADVNKGPNRPLFHEEFRCEALAALECVDYVALNVPTPGDAILMLRPDIYAKGAEYRDAMTEPLRQEQQAVESIGGQLIFTDEAEFHSSDLISKVVAHG